MDTSGHRTKTLARINLSVHGFLQYYHLKSSLKAFIILVIIMTNYGCAQPTIQFGKPPLTARLAELKIDVSNENEVRNVLGEPQAKGAVRSPSFGLKEAWLYESTQVEGTMSHERMLMVFLDKDRGVYHGHLWFTYGLLLDQTK